MRVRIIILGDAGTGKSCLIKRYCEPSRFAGTKYMPTIGVDYGTKTFTTAANDSHPPLILKIDFFDLSGDGNYTEVRNEFYTNVDGVLLTFDVTSKRSFESLRRWQEEVSEYGLFTPSAMTTAIVVGTKIDRPREVKEEEGLAFAIQNNATYFETSAKTGEGVDDLFQYMLQELTRMQQTKPHNDSR